MEIGQFALKHDMGMIGSRDISGAASTCAIAIYCIMHRSHYCRVLAHAEIVVRTPHRDRIDAVFTVELRIRECTGLAL